MLRKLSTLLLILAGLGGVGFTVYEVWRWTQLASAPPDEPAMQAIAALNLWVGLGILAAWFVGYAISFDSRRPRRPFILLYTSLFFAGGCVGMPLREYLGAYLIVDAVVPVVDVYAIGLYLGCALLPLGIVYTFEAANRALWPSMATGFDRKGFAGPALFCNRVALLFRPGQAGMLRSVALTRFRNGVRSQDVVEVLVAIHDAGKADPDILEALCKYSSEQNDSERYLKYLRELHEQVPQEDQIRDALVDELMAQRRHADALELIERSGVPDDPEALERYANALLAEGQIDKGAQVAEQLGKVEGIPFRRSQALLRDILSRVSEYVPAFNILAAQAERMALRDQRIRWLEKSLEANPRQAEIREQLITIYRALNQTVRLEQLLADTVRDDGRDFEALLEYIRILHQNEKVDEALSRLEMLTARKDAPAEAWVLQAEIHLEQQQWDPAQESAKVAAQREDLNDDQARRVEQVLAAVEKAVLTAEVAAVWEDARANPDNADLQMAALGRLVQGRHADKVVALADETLSRHPSRRGQIVEMLGEYAKDTSVPFPILNLLSDLLAASNRYEETLVVVRQMADRSLDRVQTIRDGTQKVLRRSPHHLPTLRFLGDTYLAHGRFTDMIHSYSLYLAHGGEETEQIDRALAKAYIALQDFENARRFVTQLLQANPNDVVLLKQVIPLAIQASEPEQAAEYLKQLQVADPRDPALRKLREEVDLALGERRFSFLQRELEAGKGGAELLEQLGDVASEMGRYSDAITSFQRASRQKDDPALSRRCTAKLAYCYMKKRLDDLAQETLREITINLDDDPQELATIMDILYQIGDMFTEYKMYDRAEKVFKQLCKIDAGYRDVLQRVEGLRK